MSNEERTVCNAEELCQHLSKRLGDGGKGFKAEHTVIEGDEAEKAETRFFGVSYRTSAKDCGLMLNWCPFCGGRPGPSAARLVPA